MRSLLIVVGIGLLALTPISVGAQGQFLEAAVDVSAKLHWGRRDDPFRVHRNHDVIWAWFDKAGNTTLSVARLVSGGTFECKAF